MASPSQNGSDPPQPVRIAGTGSYVPDRIMTNRELEDLVETSDDWITSRTGIRERRIAAEGELTSHMAAAAARRALEQAGVKGDEVELIIVATITRLAEPSDAVLAWFPGGFDPVHLEDGARILSANGSLATLTSQGESGWVAGIYRSGARVVLPVRRRSCLALSRD